MFLLLNGQDMQTRSFNAENAEKRFEEKLMITNQVIEDLLMLEIS